MRIGLIGGAAISKYTIAPALWRSMVSEAIRCKVFTVKSAKNIPAVLNNPSFLGFNVAKPYKKEGCNCTVAIY